MLLCVTFFRNFGAQTKTEEFVSLRSLAPRLRDTTARTKAELPWLKLARFGDLRSPKNSLRHDDNVREIHGVEADYDGEAMTLNRAQQILSQAGVAAVLYTSPSHKADAPRWRILCPVSEALPPSERAKMLARVNGLFLGALANESFTLSQSYYYGHTPEATEHAVILVEGQHIDLLDHLDAGAVGKPTKPRMEPVANAPRRHLGDNWHGGTPYGRKALENECNAIRGAAEGEKHPTLNRAAYSIGGLVAAGELNDGAAMAELRHALGDIRSRCADFDAAERTLSEAYDAGKAAPRQAPPPREVRHTVRVEIVAPEPPPYDAPPEYWSAEPVIEVPAEPIEVDANQKPPLPLVYFGDVQPSLDAADFVEGVLTDQAMSVVYGPSNCGKTFFVSDLALHVATGKPWRGREIEYGGVIYCALEGSHGIANRVAAWRQHYDCEGVEVPFAVVPVSINLLDPDADRTRLAVTIAIAAANMGVAVKLVVIDTLSRAMAGGNENAPDDMGALVASADFIRQTCKAHICFIHHSGKDEAKGARGHSLLRAATDTEIEISRQDSQSPSVARVTKQREMEIDGEWVFKLTPHELGVNKRGKPVTSCIVETVEGEAPPKIQRKAAKLPDGAQIALDSLSSAISDTGTKRNNVNLPPGALTVLESEWRRAFYARLPDEAPEAKKKAFQRATAALQGRRVAIIQDGFAWIVKQEASK